MPKKKKQPRNHKAKTIPRKKDSKGQLILEQSDEQKKAFATYALNKKITDYSKKWLNQPPEIQMQNLRNQRVRESLIGLKIVDQDDVRVKQIIQEEEESAEFMKQKRNESKL